MTQSTCFCSLMEIKLVLYCSRCSFPEQSLGRLVGLTSQLSTSLYRLNKSACLHKLNTMFLKFILCHNSGSVWPRSKHNAHLFVWLTFLPEAAEITQQRRYKNLFQGHHSCRYLGLHWGCTIYWLFFVIVILTLATFPYIMQISLLSNYFFAFVRNEHLDQSQMFQLRESK